MLRLKFWGVRGSCPTPLSPAAVRDKIFSILQRLRPADLADEEKMHQYVNTLPLSLYGTYGGNTACVTLESAEGLLIIDAGTGLVELGRGLSREQGKTGCEYHLLVSHTHWDHIQGFPFFAPNYNPANTVHVHSPAMQFAERFAGQQLPQYFPITAGQYPATVLLHQLDPDREQVIGGFQVANMRMHHPNSSFAYAVSGSGRKIVYCTDAEFFRQRSEYLERAIDFFRGSDVLVFDAQYTEQDTIRKADWGHSSLEMGIDMAVEAGVRRLIGFHHDPNHDDELIELHFQKALEYQRRHYPHSDLIVNVGYEGLQVELPGE